MNVLIACEFSGRVRDAFIRKGHDAVSCDFKPSELPGRHIQGDVKPLLNGKLFDLMIGFPPCTFLCFAGIRWNVGNEWRQDQTERALKFFIDLFECDIKKIALENPVGIIPRRYKKWDQIIHPWQFGHNEEKKTCLWLKNLPKLEPTKIVTENIKQSAFKHPGGPNRSDDRSRTFLGIAEAMAEQWG